VSVIEKLFAMLCLVLSASAYQLRTPAAVVPRRSAVRAGLFDDLIPKDLKLPELPKLPDDFKLPDLPNPFEEESGGAKKPAKSKQAWDLQIEQNVKDNLGGGAPQNILPEIKMEMPGWLSKAFSNQEFLSPPMYQAAEARASHILVKTTEEALELKSQLAAGADFAELARQYSTCPSSAKGGDLGGFGPGQMVPEFDAVVFNDAVKLGDVTGPVQTEFGSHLIVVTSRKERW
jgi:peptidyl-prolyl cis-trans isomerase C